MRIVKALAALLLCLCFILSFAGCSNNEDPAATTAPAGTGGATVPSTAPVDYAALYAAAKEELSGAQDLVIHYTVSHSRTAGSETFTENRTGTGSYLGLHTDNMEALIKEELTFGSYTTEYIESYISGCAYTRVNNYSYRCGISPEEFMTQQIGAVLLDEALYADITGTSTADGCVIAFSDPSLAESWLQLDGQAVLTDAGGSAVLDAGGAMTGAEYHAQYMLGNILCKLDVTVSVECAAAEITTQQPVYHEDCPELSHLQIPRYILRTVGNVYSAEAMSVSYTDTLYSQAFAVIRSQSSTIDTYGSGERFMAQLTSQVTVTDLIGNVSENSQVITYRDGVYSAAVNGSAPTTDTSFTAQQIRTSCEDSVLSALFTLDAIASARLTDTGDFLCIEFTGTGDFAENICSSIYSLFGMDLDTFAESYTTESAGGYLTLNKYTLLPTAMGIEVSRSHVIDNVSYPLTYQLDQAIELPSLSAYENITGEQIADPVSDQGAAPLFYKVTGSSGETMWLLGTVHIGDSRTASLPQQVMDAFRDSDALAVEYNIVAFQDAVYTDSALQSSISKAYYYSGTTAQSKLTDAQYQRLYPMTLACGGNNINSPYLKIAVWQNLIENLYLQQSYGLSAEYGMDMRLLRWAMDQDIKVYEIESGLEQIQMLTGFSDALQIMLLEQLLNTGMIGYYQEAAQLYALWCQGDEAALLQALTEDTSAMTDAEKKLYDEYYKAMYLDRNKVMLKAAKQYLGSGETVFYAVGLAHLLGNDGLVAALQAEGYTVEAVTYS